MDLKLAGRRALVTGSSSGLGAATARLLAKEGAAVVVHGRDEARADAVAKQVRADGGKADVALGDLGTDAGADAVAGAALAGGDVDILVNNAGTYQRKSWANTTSQEWLETYDANVVSGVRMIQRLVPLMRERGWGRVIQIGGGLAQQPSAEGAFYNATLAARHNLAVSLARELKDTGVTSNVVSPGAILVSTVQRIFEAVAPTFGWGESAEEIERGVVRDLLPNDIGRLGRPEEVASAVVYLASPLADYVSGAVLRVDGGTIRTAF